ncbi:MAG TPA: N-acetylmuramoyl-L-alanine amidase [Gemmatimonadaceae bacterium]|nr:N-acetylmuramoyl-L-alanine amidase [Gemmatimonadaceae bacterium]
MPAGVTYLSRSEWGAKPPVLPMKPHTPVRLTIHHTGVAQAPNRSLTDKLRGLQLFSQRDDSLASGRRKPAWADIPYHFYIGVDGTVGEARDWRFVGDSNTPYDPTGHLLVVVEGNFEKDSLTTPQRRALELIVPALSRHFRISPERLASHRDFAETSCPGRNIYSELPRLRSLIATTR